MPRTCFAIFPLFLSLTLLIGYCQGRQFVQAIPAAVEGEPATGKSAAVTLPHDGSHGHGRRLLGHALAVRAERHLPANSKAEAVQQAAEYAGMGKSERRALFLEWKRGHGRNYNATEIEERYQLFLSRLDEVIQTNSDSRKPFWAGLNKFSDRTAEERRAMLITDVDPPPPHMAEDINPLSLEEASGSEEVVATGRRLQAPLSVDWVAAGKVTPVKDQGTCGSCWAYAALGAVESLHLLKTGLRLDLSEQEMVDCVYSSDGCIGGWPDKVYTYMYMRNVTKEMYYPYTGTYNGCKAYAMSTTAVKDKVGLYQSPGYGRVQSYSSSAMINAIARQPVTIAMQLTDSFYSYAGGIYTGPDCTYSEVSVNHAVLAVGYNVAAGLSSSFSYLKLKNSWGTDWGESGYMKIRTMSGTSTGTCYTYYYGGYPIGVTPATPPAPPPPRPPRPPPPRPPRPPRPPPPHRPPPPAGMIIG